MRILDTSSTTEEDILKDFGVFVSRDDNNERIAYTDSYNQRIAYDVDITQDEVFQGLERALRDHTSNGNRCGADPDGLEDFLLLTEDQIPVFNPGGGDNSGSALNFLTSVVGGIVNTASAFLGLRSTTSNRKSNDDNYENDSYSNRCSDSDEDLFMSTLSEFAACSGFDMKGFFDVYTVPIISTALQCTGQFFQGLVSSIGLRKNNIRGLQLISHLCRSGKPGGDGDPVATGCANGITSQGNLLGEFFRMLMVTPGNSCGCFERLQKLPECKSHGRRGKIMDGKKLKSYACVMKQDSCRFFADACADRLNALRDCLPTMEQLEERSMFLGESRLGICNGIKCQCDARDNGVINYPARMMELPLTDSCLRSANRNSDWGDIPMRYSMFQYECGIIEDIPSPEDLVPKDFPTNPDPKPSAQVPITTRAPITNITTATTATPTNATTMATAATTTTPATTATTNAPTASTDGENDSNENEVTLTTPEESEEETVWVIRPGQNSVPGTGGQEQTIEPVETESEIFSPSSTNAIIGDGGQRQEPASIDLNSGLMIASGSLVAIAAITAVGITLRRKRNVQKAWLSSSVQNNSGNSSSAGSGQSSFDFRPVSAPSYTPKTDWNDEL